MKGLLFQETIQGEPNLFSPLFWREIVRMVAFFVVPINAVLKVGGKQDHAQLIQCGPERRDLGEYVHAIPLILDHLFDAVHLAIHPGDSIESV